MRKRINVKRSVACALVFGLWMPALALGPFDVDFNREIGVVKRLNGVCNAAPISYTQDSGIEERVKDLEIPFYRFHDAALENPGYSLVDVSRIFPLFHLDPDDPKNYRFKETDDYIRGCVESGAKIDFRLGESIEHARSWYRILPPTDFAKWAEICAHIVRHYNCGWADGYEWNIQYWSIWEEPDNQELLKGEDAYRKIYFPLYETTAKRLKSEFPNIKVGGPNCMGPWERPKAFIDYCHEHKAPLDFLSWTLYCRNNDSWVTCLRWWRRYLDSLGMTNTEIFVSEWHFGPVSWQGHGCVTDKAKAVEWHRELTDIPAVAYTAETLIRLQDEPVDAMFFYSMNLSSWGLFDGDREPVGHYYAMKAFAALAHGSVRVCAPLVPERNWSLLASKDGNGKGYVLLVARHADGIPKLALRGCEKPVSVKVVDSLSKLGEVRDWDWKDGVLTIPRHCSDSAIWLVEVELAH